MQIRNYLTLVLMVFSTTSFGAGAVQMFATKSECLRHFTISSGTSNIAAGDAYCKDKVVKTATDICADKKLLDFKIKNSISSVQESQYFQKFKLECVSASTATGAGQQANQSAQTAERDAQIAQQQAAMVSQQQAAAAAQAGAAAAAAAKAQGATAQQQQAAAANAQLEMLKAILPVVDKVGATHDKAVAEAAKAAGKTPAAKAEEIPFPEMSAADKKVALDKANAEDAARDMEGSSAPEVAPEVAAKAVEAGGSVTPADAAGAAARLEQTNPPLGKVANDAQKSTSTPSDAPAPPTEISSSSQATTASTQSTIKSTESSATTTLSAVGLTPPYSTTVAGLKEFDAKWQSFVKLKETCTKLAETSGFLCIEGTSPGAQATKALVDASGPILGAISSAQKACSSTADVTGLASKVMTIAKATCVTAKMACDSGCAAANASLKELEAMIKTLNTKAQADSKTVLASPACLNPYTKVACQGENTTKQTSANQAIQSLSASLKKETPPTAGTVPYMSAKCAANMRDIVALAANVIQLVMAQKSAADCDKKLSADGNGGGAVTPTQYCEMPANSGTQFCKCKQNANQEGCPGFAGKGSLIGADANKDSVAGINLKTGKGLSSFAGGSRGTATGFGPNGKQEYNPAAPGTGDKLAMTGADAAAAGSGGGFGGGSAGGGTAEGASGKPEDKKWSFGSFANALGGMFGGGSGGKGANNKGNGNASNSKQEAAIKRKIASDKLAGEITSASGKSNWEKVHQVYLIKDSTLITGN